MNKFGFIAAVTCCLFAGSGFAGNEIPEGVHPYGAAAYGYGEDSERYYVSSGVGGGSTVEEAEANALEACRTANVPACEVIGSFHDGGCGYISVGRATSDVGFGAGETAEEALEECAASGYSCSPEKVSGFCTAPF